MPLRAKSAGGGMTDQGEAPRRAKPPGGRQTMVRGLRIACRNILTNQPFFFSLHESREKASNTDTTVGKSAR